METYTEAEVKNLKEGLTPIKQKLLFGISEWWGEGDYGMRGKIITDDKKLYEYLFNYKVSSRTYPRNENYIKLVKTLSEAEYKIVLDFINEKIKNKQFENHAFMDGGITISARCDGSLVEISDNLGDLWEEAKSLFATVSE